MFKSLIEVNIRMLENGVINKFVVYRQEQMVSFNGNKIKMPVDKIDRWLAKFFRLLRQSFGKQNEIYDRRNIATIEIMEQKKNYSVVMGGKHLELLNKLIDEVV